MWTRFSVQEPALRGWTTIRSLLVVRTHVRPAVAVMHAMFMLGFSRQSTPPSTQPCENRDIIWGTVSNVVRRRSLTARWIITTTTALCSFMALYLMIPTRIIVSPIREERATRMLKEI